MKNENKSSREPTWLSHVQLRQVELSDSGFAYDTQRSF